MKDFLAFLAELFLFAAFLFVAYMMIYIFTL